VIEMSEHQLTCNGAMIQKCLNGSGDDGPRVAEVIPDYAAKNIGC